MLGKGTPSRRLRDTPVIRCPLPQTSSPANPLLKGKSVTYVSGTKCYLCLRSLTCNSSNLRLFGFLGFFPVFFTVPNFVPTQEPHGIQHLVRRGVNVSARHCDGTVTRDRRESPHIHRLFEAQ